MSDEDKKELEENTEAKAEVKEVTSHDVVNKESLDRIKRRLEKSKASEAEKESIIQQLEEFLQWKITNENKPKVEKVEVEEKKPDENKPKLSFSPSNLFTNLNDLLFK